MSAFGAGSRQQPNLREFITSTRTILNLAISAIAFISFCAVVSFSDPHGCLFNLSSTCGFAKFVIGLALAHGVIFVAIEWQLDKQDSLLNTSEKRKLSVTYQLLFSLVWTLFHFCLFCATWAGWNQTKNDPERDENAIGLGAGTAKTVISFTFFNTILFGVKAFKLFQLWQIGNWAVPEYDSEALAGAKPFTSFPGGNMQTSTFPDQSSGVQAADLVYG
ncbi:Oidioi.mRNA.OKI2018_I69.XSR.g16996.t1.cds [Oikopleura dioica]|uniref:Oidioi.mRNA.OKI2018_I69.XSR.g16996.t1.cds n=1 Tax=Oikopleura dioica TaxID=34765 RepID=A0ABN7SMJ6_OIKDI|nr:Oidioi.mRNA.OKI2018_I69.XSR.g16996.t1.cds [Oikopleura dioica]